MTDLDLDHIEALVGPLPKTDHALASAETRKVLMVEIVTDAINELLAVIEQQAQACRAERARGDAYLANWGGALETNERQARMLQIAARISWTEGEGSDAPMPDEFVEFYLADLARRAKEANDE